MVHTCGSSYFAGRHNSNFFLWSDGADCEGIRYIGLGNVHCICNSHPDIGYLQKFQKAKKINVKC